MDRTCTTMAAQRQLAEEAYSETTWDLLNRFEQLKTMYIDHMPAPDSDGETRVDWATVGTANHIRELLHDLENAITGADDSEEE